MSKGLNLSQFELVWKTKHKRINIKDYKNHCFAFKTGLKIGN